MPLLSVSTGIMWRSGNRLRSTTDLPPRNELQSQRDKPSQDTRKSLKYQPKTTPMFAPRTTPTHIGDIVLRQDWQRLNARRQGLRHSHRPRKGCRQSSWRRSRAPSCSLTETMLTASSRIVGSQKRDGKKPMKPYLSQAYQRYAAPSSISCFDWPCYRCPHCRRWDQGGTALINLKK